MTNEEITKMFFEYATNKGHDPEKFECVCDERGYVEWTTPPNRRGEYVAISLHKPTKTFLTSIVSKK